MRNPGGSEGGSASPVPGPAAAAAGPREEPSRILLVEDDEGDAVIVSDLLLAAWPELVIERARNLQEAERALSPSIHCVVLDLGLPDAQGMEALQRLRAVEADMPVVVLTGDTDTDRGIESLGAGAQDYLVKGAIGGPDLARAIRHSAQRKLADRLERELAILRVQSAENARVQRGLIPQPLVQDPRIRVASAYRPGNRRQVLGGDFFDVVQSSPAHLQVMLGDVCGHGPDEAALGVQLRIAWRTLILAGVPQDQLLVTLDRLFAQERHAPHLFATLASLSIDLSAGTGSVALAGHPAPIVRTRSWSGLLSERPGGPPLGVDETPSWQAREVELGDSWSLLLFSDGIYEGRVGERGGRLGLDGLADLVARDADTIRRYVTSPEQLIDDVEELNRGPLPDDVALLALACDDERG